MNQRRVYYDSQFSRSPHAPDLFYYKCYSALKINTKVFIAPCYIYDNVTWESFLLVSLMTSRCGKLYFLLLDKNNVLSHVCVTNEQKYLKFILDPVKIVDMLTVNNVYNSWITGDRKLFFDFFLPNVPFITKVPNGYMMQVADQEQILTKLCSNRNLLRRWKDIHQTVQMCIVPRPHFNQLS
jgi:hypothetical protein